MQLNPTILLVLQEHNIDKDQGLLCLFAYHFGLNPETSIKPEVLQAVNIAKIVERDYNTNQLTWNIGLFEGQETGFEWVRDWMEPFGKINPDRKGVFKTVMAHMKRFFAENPTYRKDDVYKARDLYFRTLTSGKYLMKSHKFISDGMGSTRNSTLLMYCERLTASSSTTNQVGKIIK